MIWLWKGGSLTHINQWFINSEGYKSTVSSFMSTHLSLSQCEQPARDLRSERIFVLIRRQFLVRDINLKLPDSKLSIFLLHQLLKSAVSVFYVKEWIDQHVFIFSWGKLKLYINFKQNYPSLNYCNCKIAKYSFWVNATFCLGYQ